MSVDANGDGTVDYRDVVGFGVPTPPPAANPSLDRFLGSLATAPPATPLPTAGAAR